MTLGEPFAWPYQTNGCGQIPYIQGRFGIQNGSPPGNPVMASLVLRPHPLRGKGLWHWSTFLVVRTSITSSYYMWSSLLCSTLANYKWLNVHHTPREINFLTDLRMEGVHCKHQFTWLLSQQNQWKLSPDPFPARGWGLGTRLRQWPQGGGWWHLIKEHW